MKTNPICNQMPSIEPPRRLPETHVYPT